MFVAYYTYPLRGDLTNYTFEIVSLGQETMSLWSFEDDDPSDCVWIVPGTVQP